MAGLNKYDDKQRRAMRRRNHIARDLLSPKYHQRIIEARKHKAYEEELGKILKEKDTE